MMPRFNLGVLAVAFVLALAAGGRADQPLTDYQQKIFDEVKTGLDAAKQGLADAKAKLDAGDGSAAGTAYNAAVRNYNNQVRRLGQLPAGSDAVAALRKDAEAIGVTLKETGVAIKAGPTAKPPAAGGDAKPAPQPAGAKLDYRQVEALKNARFHLKEVEPRAARIVELTGGKLDADAIREALDLMKFVHQRMGNAVKALNDLPGDHPEVAAESKRYNELLAKLQSAQAAIEKAAPAADKEAAALGQQMTDDLAMVESWRQSLGNPQALFQNRPDDAIATVGQLPQMRQAMADMLQRWNTRAAEKPNDKATADMVRKLKYVDGQLTDLETYTKQLAKTLPEQIGKDLAAVDKLIETAVTEKRPAYFGPDGGIRQQMGFAEQKAKLLKAIDPAAAEAAAKSLAATVVKSTAAQKALAGDIIAGNKKPDERYNGPDKEDLRKQVIDTWKKQHPADEIIAVVFTNDGWSRTTRWDWSRGNQGFGKVDYDHQQPKLFYKLNDQQAVQVPVEIYKDYMKDGRIVIKPWDREAEPSVTNIYLLANLK